MFAHRADYFPDYLHAIYAKVCIAYIATRLPQSDYMRLYALMCGKHRFAPRALFETHDRAKVRSVCRDGGCVPQTIGNVVKVLASVDSVTALHNTRNANRIRQFRDTRWKSFIHVSRRCSSRSESVKSLPQFFHQVCISRHFRYLLFLRFFFVTLVIWYW